MTAPSDCGRRPALTHLGTDVRIVGRRADGRAIVAYLDRHGEPIAGRFGAAWPHELRGVGWHIAEVKDQVAAAPLFGGHRPITPPAPRLGAHFSLPKED